MKSVKWRIKPYNGKSFYIVGIPKPLLHFYVTGMAPYVVENCLWRNHSIYFSKGT